MRSLVALGSMLVLVACASSAEPRPRPREEPRLVETTPVETGSDEVEATPPLDVPEDTSAPDGPACIRSAECEGGLACRGAPGCSAPWACGAPRDCEGASTVAYCDCDGLTFHAPAGCPGRSYRHVGPCEPFGPLLAEGEDMGIPAGDEPITDADRICESSSDCRRFQVCMGLPGCATEWRCVRARGCGGRRTEFCGCDGATFTANARCPGRSYLHTGPCRGDETMVASAGSDTASSDATRGPTSGTASASEPRTSSDARSTEPRATDARATDTRTTDTRATDTRATDTRTAGTRTSDTRSTETATAPAATEPAQPATPERGGCRSSRDCPRGLVCQGPEGCEGEWTCGRPAQPCIRDTQVFCGCDGEDFRASMFCPAQPYRHRGSCEIDRIIELSGARIR